MEFSNMGELMDGLANQEKIHGVKFWMQDIERTTKEQPPEGVWEEFRAKLISQDEILILAEALREAISYEASQWSQEEPYHDTLRRGHDLLRLLFAIALIHGIEVSIGEIDGPLTPTESMEVAGIIEVDNGKVKLTEAGMKLAKEFEEELGISEKGENRE